MRKLTDEERGWVAGFLEGEGCIRALKQTGCKKLQLRWQASQVQREPLDRLAALVGGRVNGPYHDSRPGTRMQPYHTWALTKRADFDALNAEIGRLLSPVRYGQLVEAYAAREASCAL